MEDFDDDAVGTTGNWVTTDALASVQVQGGTNTLYAEDLSGGSSFYNNVDFPKDMHAAGCELHYDVEYLAGSSNGTSAPNSINIYTGPSLPASTARAFFVLNSGSLIPSGGGVTHIVVPLELATGTTLPSNAFGQWMIIGGGTTTTATDVANFNALIQNIDGAGFVVDNGGNPAEKWWYDNFCFQQCCD
jgi:hypothetical protein